MDPLYYGDVGNIMNACAWEMQAGDPTPELK